MTPPESLPEFAFKLTVTQAGFRQGGVVFSAGEFKVDVEYDDGSDRAVVITQLVAGPNSRPRLAAS